MSADERCVWCEEGTGTHWHTYCWHEAHDYFDARGNE